MKLHSTKKEQPYQGIFLTPEKGTTNIPKPMPGLVIPLYTFFPLLFYEGMIKSSMEECFISLLKGKERLSK